MLINRNNYETFFLLYADDELQAHERLAVELFIAENQDLKGELDLLQAAVLPTEEVIFTDKSFLYKPIVFTEEVQEKLLLKLDNELSSDALNTVDLLFTENKEIQEAYSLLQQTQLNSNDIIVFKHKNLLYKKERDNVIVFKIARWAAAAIFIGFTLFIGLNKYNKTAVSEDYLTVTDKTTAPNNIKDTLQTTAGKNIIETAGNDLKDTAPNLTDKTKNALKDKGNKASYAATTNSKKETEEKRKEASINEIIFAKKDIVQPITPNEIVPQKNDVIIAQAINTKPNNKTIIDENIVPLENTYAQVASFTDNEKSENKIFYMDEDEVKRSKVGGVFKKLKRFVERTARIKTGNSLKIAGFEIAAK